MMSNEAKISVVSPETTLASIALRGDAYAALLDRHGFDFCRGGTQTLAQSCASHGLDVSTLLTELEAAGQDEARVSPADWNQRPLGELIAYILDTHHAFTRSCMARISRLLPKVVAKHGTEHPHLASVAALFGQLATDMEPHMLREEKILFPYIRALETSGTGIGTPPFGTVRNPVRMMMREHDTADQLLAALHEATNGFQPPSGACTATRAVHAALAALRIDLLRHISLENELLFPRAIELEVQKSRGATSRGGALPSP